MRKKTTQNSACQQQQRSSGPAVSLDVVQLKQVLVREEVAVDAGEDDTRQRIVLESTTGDGLAAALKGDEGEGQQHGPVDAVFALGCRVEGDDEGGSDSEEQLRGEGGADDPTAFGGEETVEAGEEEGTDAKGEEGDARAVEPRADGWVDERGNTESNINSISYISPPRVNIVIQMKK